MRFVHPQNYNPPSKKNANDYDVGIVGYPLDDQRPIYGALFASPWADDGAVSRCPVKNMRSQVDVFVGFRNLKRTPDMLVQVAVGHGPVGKWPNQPGLAVISLT